MYLLVLIAGTIPNLNIILVVLIYLPSINNFASKYGHKNGDFQKQSGDFQKQNRHFGAKTPFLGV